MDISELEPILEKGGYFALLVGICVGLFVLGRTIVQSWIKTSEAKSASDIANQTKSVDALVLVAETHAKTVPELTDAINQQSPILEQCLKSSRESQKACEKMLKTIKQQDSANDETIRRAARESRRTH